MYYSQLIRYGRISSKLVTFKSKVKGLVHKLKTQGYKFEDLRRLSLRFFKERREISLILLMVMIFLKWFFISFIYG